MKRWPIMVKAEIPRYIEAETEQEAKEIAISRVADALNAVYLAPSEKAGQRSSGASRKRKATIQAGESR